MRQDHPDTDRLTAFLFGMLSTEDSTPIEEHLAECDTCTQFLETMPDDPLCRTLRDAFTSTCEMSAHRELPVAKTIPTELEGHERYHILEILGSGGMGTVYKAIHLLMDRVVALKVVNPDLTQSPAAIVRFRREVKAAARLSHPNIVTCYDADHAGDTQFLVMEFVEGITLAQHVAEQGPLPIQEACNYACQVAHGLQHALEQGMVHRDIKPQNLMLTDDGRVKILDFGLAKFASELDPSASVSSAEEASEPSGPEINASSVSEEEGAPATTENTPGAGTDAEILRAKHWSLTGCGVLGTPSYIAPEQARDAGRADFRSDIYSLGGTLCFLLTGKAPGCDNHHSNQSLSASRDLPSELVQIIERMMALEPACRYQSFDEIEHALAALSSPGEQPRVTLTTSIRSVWLWAVTAILLIGVIGVASQVLILKHGATIEIKDGKVAIKTDSGTFQNRKVDASIKNGSADVSSNGRTLCYLHPENDALVFHDLDGGREILLPVDHWIRHISRLSLSPDGSQVAYTWFNAPDRSCQLRIIGRDGRPSRTLLDDKTIRHVHVGEWSPRGDCIVAVVSRNRTSSELVLVPIRGGDVRVLAEVDFWPISELHFGTNWRELCFSPDGDYIVYDARTRKGATDRDIFLLSADSTRRAPPERIIKNAADDYVLGWAADGRIVFASDREATWDAWAIRIGRGQTRGEPTIVRKGIGPISPLGFTKDGTFYYRRGALRSYVHTTRLDVHRNSLVAHRRLLARHRFEAGSFSPDWSPDGKSLAYAVFPPQHLGMLNPPSVGGHDLVLIRDEETGRERELKPQVGPIYYLRWSPNGESLLINAHRGQFLINVGTDDEEAKALASHLKLATWSDGGKGIVYRHEDLEGGDRIRRRWLDAGKTEDLVHVPRPNVISSIAVSPSGEELAYVTFDPETSSSAIYIKPMKGGAERKRLQLGANEWISLRTLVWTHDGQHILFVKRTDSNGEVNKREVCRIVAKGDSSPLSLWSTSELPDARAASLIDLRVHPDDQRVAFVVLSTSSEIAAMDNLLPRDDTLGMPSED